MRVTPADLVRAGARHRWPDGAQSVLLTVPGPTLAGSGAAELVWFDPFLDPAHAGAAAVSLAGGVRTTAVMVVEWPAGPLRPEGARAGAAAAVGDLAAVVHWAPAPGVDGRQAAFDCSYGVGAVVLAASRGRAVEAVARRSFLEPVVERVRREHVAPLELDGLAAGLAFDCGTGSSRNPLWLGLDPAQRPVAVVADLELLRGAAGAA